MSGLKSTLLLVLLAIVLRLGLFYAGVHVKPFMFIPVQLLLVVLATYFSGHLLLNHDPSRGFGELLRAGFQTVLLYAFLISVFSWIFYKAVDTTAFTAYNEKLLQSFVDQGFPKEEAQEKMSALYNAANYAAITFFGLFFVGSFNALAFAALHHKLLRKFRS